MMNRSCNVKRHGDKGFTLLEVLLVLAISAIIFQIAYTLLFAGYASFKRISASVDVQENVRLAMGYIMRMLYASNSADVVLNEGKHQLAVNGSLFYKSGNSLYEQRDGIANEIAYNISDFIVEQDGANIRITIKSDDGRGHAFSLSSEYALRR